MSIRQLLYAVMATGMIVSSAMGGDPVGACCYCNGCDVMTEADCEAYWGSQYQGDGVDCALVDRCEQVIHMPDPNLRALVQSALGGCVLTRFNMEKLVGFDAVNAGISNLTGLEHAIHMHKLVLEGNPIIDIAPLAWMTELEYLGVSYTYLLSDLSPLQNLTSLRALWLGHNQIEYIDPLAELTLLNDLWLTDNHVISIEPLRGLPLLYELWLSFNQISDIDPLTEMPSLRELGIADNPIISFEPLAELMELQVLWMAYNNIGDISVLAGMADLWELGLMDTQISDISPLVGLAEMEFLYLQDNTISNVFPLTGMTHLTEPSLINNPLSLESRCVHIPVIQDNNPDAEIMYDDTPHGACCLADGSCLDDLLQTDCEAAPDYQSWSECEACGNVECDPTGRCCFPDGSCSVETPLDCDIGGGEYSGDGTDCAGPPCPIATGACCFPDGSCSTIMALTCVFNGGSYQGDFTHCISTDCPCPADVDGDGTVGFSDLLAVLAAWGPCGDPCPEDIDGDGEVGFADLLAVLSAWGPCPE